MNRLLNNQPSRSFGASLLAFPTACLLAALIAGPAVRWVDQVTGWRLFDFSPEGARAVLGALTSAMMTFIVFAVSSMLVVLQLASAQLTPRIIALTLSNRSIYVSVGVFTFTYAYTLSTVGRVETVVPQLAVTLAVVSNLACIVMFFIFTLRLAAGLRPVIMLQRVARDCRAVIDKVYPRADVPTSETVERTRVRLPSAARVIEYAGESGMVLSFRAAAVVAVAREAGTCAELVPQVGDFIARGDPLFLLAEEQRPVDVRALQQTVSVGPERTMEQDPRYGFRIIVDIATKALSPAINDPTTAVQALDQIHHLLLHLGRRKLDDGEARDAGGKIRLIYGTPCWDDFVALAVSEIRLFGGQSIQVDRRLRAMLDHLVRALPDARHPPLQKELRLLKRAVERGFADEEDRNRAEVGDYQGIGRSES